MPERNERAVFACCTFRCKWADVHLFRKVKDPPSMTGGFVLLQTAEKCSSMRE